MMHEHRFAPGDLIWYMSEGKICSAAIQAIMVVENQHDDWNSTKEQKSIFTPFGPAGIYYSTVHAILPNADVFGSKADLVEWLARE